jgi:hypothetical protein
MRSLIATGAYYGLKLEQMDVVSVFFSIRVSRKKSTFRFHHVLKYGMNPRNQLRLYVS